MNRRTMRIHPPPLLLAWGRVQMGVNMVPVPLTFALSCQGRGELGLFLATDFDIS